MILQKRLSINKEAIIQNMSLSGLLKMPSFGVTDYASGDRRPLPQISNSNAWKRSRDALWFPKGRQLTVHHLRHTFSTRLREADANGLDIDDLMGHAHKGEIRRRYSHSNLVKLVKVVNLVDTTRPKAQLYVLGG